jgi:hypothetical protein
MTNKTEISYFRRTQSAAAELTEAIEQEQDISVKEVLYA